MFVVFFCLAIVSAEVSAKWPCFCHIRLMVGRQVWHTNVPVWALLLALVLPIMYVLPSGFIFAMTGQPVREYSSKLEIP